MELQEQVLVSRRRFPSSELFPKREKLGKSKNKVVKRGRGGNRSKEKSMRKSLTIVGNNTAGLNGKN